MQAHVNGISVRYELTGPASAPVVVLSHCLAGSLSIWDPQLEALQRKYRLLRYDTRGHGGTSAPAEAYTMQMLAADVIALIDDLGLQEVHFMGISMGGMIGQTLALMHPERISSLILCDTTCIVPDVMRPTWEERIEAAGSKGMAALVDATLERWFSPEFRRNEPGTVQKIRDIVLTTPVEGFAGCSHAIMNFNVKNKLPELETPTLIMVGENDPGTTVEAAEQIHQQISNSVMVVLPGAYHLSNIEAAGAFNENLLAFLKKQ